MAAIRPIRCPVSLRPITQPLSMANSFGTETPPAPNPGMGNALMSGAGPAPPAPQQPGPGGPPQPQPAPPTHAQTVAALRHFDAIRKELEIVAKDPALGKSSVKSKIIDGVMRLVAERFMKPVQAVDELSKVPAEPLMQMKWVKTMYAQAQQAENGILDHYGATQPHLGTVADHFAGTKGTYNPDDHQDHLSALAANVRGPQNAG
jgi:hypothetical protein